MRTITITVLGRPGYFEKLIDSLRRQNPDLLSKYQIVAAFEPTPNRDLCIDIYDRLDANTEVLLNPRLLGVKRNPEQLWNKVFDEYGADFNLYLEEDLVLAPDALDMVEWWWNLKNRDEYLCLNLHSYWSRSDCPPLNDDVIYDHTTESYGEHPPFIALGFATTREKWNDYFRPLYWTRGEFSWCGTVAKHIRENDRGVRGLMPQLARANHIGEHGTHCSSDVQRKRFSPIEIFDGETVPEYRVVPGTEWNYEVLGPFEARARS